MAIIFAFAFSFLAQIVPAGSNLSSVLSQRVAYAATDTTPHLVNFQGRLADHNGYSIPNGSYNMKFRLYTTPTGGTPVWEADYLVANSQGIQIAGGLFSIQLGDSTVSSMPNGNLTPSLFAGNPNLYLSVELPDPTSAASSSPTWSEGEMSPRQALASTPFAMNAETVDGVDSSQLARTDQGNTFTSNNTFSNDLTVNGASNLASVTASGTVTVQGGNVSIGGTSQAGSLTLSDGSSNTVKLQTSSQANNIVLNVPVDTNTTDTLCLATLGNCSALGAAGGDLSGNYPAPSVAKLQGSTLSISSPNTGQLLSYNGTAWVNTDSPTIAGNVTVQGAGINSFTGSMEVDGDIAGGSGTFTGTVSGADAITDSEFVTLGQANANFQSVGNYVTGNNVDYIQNTTSPQTANFNISGNGTIGGSLNIGQVGPTSYAIGDTGPAGGVIFYVDNTTTPATYYEAAPSGWSGGGADPATAWCSDSADSIMGGDSTTYDGTGNQAIGQGQTNTAAMLANCTSTAANLTASYTGGGKSDWFLPSLSELYQLYTQQAIVGGFTSSGYWSSSEYSNTNAWGVGFDTAGGEVGTDNKSVATYYVRPVRAFQTNPAITLAQNGNITTAGNVTASGTLVVGDATNGVSISPSGGYIASGSAMHVKQIKLEAEYSGAVLDSSADPSCSSAYSGGMTSGFDNAQLMNFYEWASSSSSTNCYDIVARVPIPADFDGWASAPQLYVANSNATASAVCNIVRDSSGTIDSNYSGSYGCVTPTSTLEQVDLTSLTGTYSPGGSLTILIRLSSIDPSDITKIGSLSFAYYSKF